LKTPASPDWLDLSVNPPFRMASPPRISSPPGVAAAFASLAERPVTADAKGRPTLEEVSRNKYGVEKR